MKKILYILLGLVLSTGFVACEPDFSSPVSDSTYTSGEADFSKYVAVGNSLTAGYTNGTLYKSGQANSFPSILANQMKIVGGGEFTQPYMEDDINDVGGFSFMGNPVPEFGPKLIINASVGRPERINQEPTMDLASTYPGPYNNMGVPGAKIFHLLAPGYGNIANLPMANPYYIRMASTPDASVFQDVLAQQPTFFTLWIGANDVLAFATSGGIGVDQDDTGNLDPSTYGFYDITNADVFGSIYSDMITALTANGAKGVVATIPDVASVPFFTTVPYAPLNPATNETYAAMIPELNAQFGLLNQAFAALGVPERSIVFSADSPSPLVILDQSLTDISADLSLALQAGGLDASTAGVLASQYGQCRQANENDLVLLTALSAIGQVNQAHASALVGSGMSQADAFKLSIEGITYPMEDTRVLTEDEIDHVRNVTAKFNAYIAAIADANENVAVADMAAVMQDMVDGLAIEDGSIYTADYFNGTNLDDLSFGLDGVHPTARGYAIIANEFINAIERNFGANLPKVVPAQYPTFDILTSN